MDRRRGVGVDAIMWKLIEWIAPYFNHQKWRSQSIYMADSLSFIGVDHYHR
jgi:hypothetical protein